MGVHIMSCLNQSAYTVVSITEQLGMGQASFSRTKESEVGRVHVQTALATEQVKASLGYILKNQTQTPKTNFQDPSLLLDCATPCYPQLWISFSELPPGFKSFHHPFSTHLSLLLCPASGSHPSTLTSMLSRLLDSTDTRAIALIFRLTLPIVRNNKILCFF